MSTSPLANRRVAVATTSERVLEALQRSSNNLHNWNFKKDDTDDIVKVLKARREYIPQRDLVEIILSDQEQWEKLRHAMRERKICTTMGLTGTLHEMLQERIQDIKHGDGVEL